MKRNKTLALMLLMGVLAPSMSACSSKEDVLMIRVLNSEDYIYLNDPENGYEEDDLIDQFAQYIEDDEELFAKYGKVKVVYDTADTMENIYSEMLTGKTSYDLICASDYIVAKMARYDLISKIDQELVPNYFGVDGKASAALTSRLDDIQIKNSSGVSSLGEYTVGYMWGTLGILFNPSYFDNEKEGYAVSQIIEDMANIATLWDEKYQNSISIKDSMRDTFAFGLIKAYEESYKDKDGNVHDGFRPMMENYYQNLAYSEDLDEAYKLYNDQFSDLFNYVVSDSSNPQEVINDVVKELDTLKKNIFGLEVDSGKQDIVTGKIGVNMAWSGDAVYSIDQAEDESQVSVPHELYYSVPETGSNLWMDCWVAPKLKNQTSLQWELAHEFLNYLCDPSIASKNMDYTGYTSFIAGDDIIDLVRDWYDSRTEEVFYTEDDELYYDVYAVDPSISIDGIDMETLSDEEKSRCISYEDLLSTTHDDSIDNWPLYCVLVETNEEEVEEISEIFVHPTFDEEDAVVVDDEGETVGKLYGDLTLYDTAEEDGELLYEVVDLSYFFEGTLDEYEESDMLFYSDSYSYYAHDYDKEGGIREICVGRQFYTQYPDKQTLARCAIMKDYAKGDEDLNPLIMKMWENFKSDALPLWAVILFFIIIAILVVGFGYLFLSKYLNKKIRRRRKAELNS